MKKILFTITSIIFLSCATSKVSNDYKLSEKELSRYHHKNDTIYHDSVALGYISNFELEYNPNNNNGIVVEISVTQINRADTNAGIHILKYVHTKQPNAKIELNFDGR